MLRKVQNWGSLVFKEKMQKVGMRLKNWLNREKEPISKDAKSWYEIQKLGLREEEDISKDAKKLV